MKRTLIILALGGNCPSEGVFRTRRHGILLRKEVEDPLLYTRGFGASYCQPGCCEACWFQGPVPSYSDSLGLQEAQKA